MGLFNSKSKQNFNQRLDHYFSKLENKHVKMSSIQILLQSDLLGINYRYPIDSGDQPYHIASIGKVFTATLLFVLNERSLISLEDKISKYLSRDLLDGLFVYQGVDYAGQVTVTDLVAHTSGAADYFEDPVTRGISIMEEIISYPDTLWSPESVLDFVRKNQKAVGKPGGYHYSDTGYILLGFLIENVSGKLFHENLMDEFFKPMEMDDSYLMFHSEPINLPKKQIREFWVNGIEASTFNSVSCDWAGGGIVTTTKDLLKFQRALRKGKLVNENTLQRMEICPNKFRPGIYYGLGMMEIRFEEFFFLLKGLPRITGHIGILATHMFYDKTSDTNIIMNFGNTKLMTASFKALVQVMNVLRKS